MAESSPIRLNFVPVSTDSFGIRSTLARQAIQNSEICSCVTSALQTLQQEFQDARQQYGRSPDCQFHRTRRGTAQTVASRRLRDVGLGRILGEGTFKTRGTTARSSPVQQSALSNTSAARRPAARIEAHSRGCRNTAAADI